MMDADIKTRWLEALRSGKYEQGTTYLKRHDGKMCCLGVLAEINGEEQVPGGTDKIGYSFHFSDDYWNQNMIPSGYCGINMTTANELSYLNDYDKRTFPEIANWIENNL